LDLFCLSFAWRNPHAPPMAMNYGGREPSTRELQADVDRLLGALDGPIRDGRSGPQGPISGIQSPYVSGMQSGSRTPYGQPPNGQMSYNFREGVSGGYASGTRTPQAGAYATPGERFSAQGPRLQHMDAVLESLDGRSDPSGWRSSRGGPGDFDASGNRGGFNNMGLDVPEMGNMVMPDDSDDEDAPANATNVNRLHAEMDALLADTSTPQLTAEQEMLLRQNEISNRAQMEAFRVPVTASIDRVMQRERHDPRDGPPPRGPNDNPAMMPVGMPPQVQRKQDDNYDPGIFGFAKCFRACT